MKVLTRGEPQYTNTSVTFNPKFLKPNDTITYKITIKNEGTIDAKLGNINFTSDEENGSPAIIYSTTNPSDTLRAGEETTFTVTIKYDSEITEMPSITTKTITGVVEYIQK